MRGLYLIGAVKHQAVLPANDGPGYRTVCQGEVGLEPDGACIALTTLAAQGLEPSGQLNGVAEVQHEVVFLGGSVSKKSAKKIAISR